MTAIQTVSSMSIHFIYTKHLGEAHCVCVCVCVCVFMCMFTHRHTHRHTPHSSTAICLSAALVQVWRLTCLTGREVACVCVCMCVCVCVCVCVYVCVALKSPSVRFRSWRARRTLTQTRGICARLC